MSSDPELLATFARTNSEDAFAEVVRRHVNLVYSAALRQVNGDAHLAQDVAQTVFADLAQKAASLSRCQSLTGWLYTSAHFAAANMIRGETRRRAREEKFMREPANETDQDADWEKIRPALDDAMHELKEADREAILLRYFENRQFSEVGARLGLNENAARMRVERALEKLRVIFSRRNVTTATAVETILSVHAVQTVPAPVVAKLTAAAMVKAGTGTFTLFKMMTATHLKFGISAIAMASVAAALVLQHNHTEKLDAQNAWLAQQLAQMQSDNAALSNRLANVSAGDARESSPAPSTELLKLRGDNNVLRQQADAATRRADETAQKLAAALSAQAKFTAHETETVNAAKEIGLAARIYQGDHGPEYPTNFDQLTNSLGGYKIGNIWVYDFEFQNLGAIREDSGQVVTLREGTPRQSPDGTWRRAYLFSDGSVQVATSYDGNFDQWEKVNTTPPSPTPVQASGQ